MFKIDFKMLFSYLPIVLLMIGLIMLNNHVTTVTYTVTKVSSPLTMTFSGIVMPLKNVNVTSPIDGTVSNVTAKFGEAVKKGEVLFYIQSPELQNALRNGITSYLKAKSQFASASYQNVGNAALYKAGLISKIEYMNAQDQYQSAQVALWDANETLKGLLVGIGIKEEQIEKLSLNDINKIKAVIAQATGELKIVSPIDGILSTQNKVASLSSSTSDTDKTLTTGTVIKKGEVVAIIYEMTGLNFTVNIPETQIHDITVGQKASITGAAFPKVNLQGYVEHVHHEANSGNTPDTTPTYTIRIIVPKITPEEREAIEEGMSAEITIIKERPPGIRIPLTALSHTETGYSVERINPANGKVETVSVTTGDTDQTTVEITEGLQPGDELVLPH